MTTSTLTLADFLLARIAEDEGAWVTAPYDRNGTRASRIHFENCPSLDRERPYPCECGMVARVLAECEAKRRIVARLSDAYGCQCVPAVLTALATPYSDHPDYRQEWTP